MQKEIQIEREKLLKGIEAQKAKNNFHKGMEASNLDGPAAAEEEEGEEQRVYGTFNGKPLPPYLLLNNNEHAKKPNNYRPHPNLLRARRNVKQNPSIEEKLAAAIRLLKND